MAIVYSYHTVDSDESGCRLMRYARCQIEIGRQMIERGEQILKILEFADQRESRPLQTQERAPGQND